MTDAITIGPEGKLIYVLIEKREEFDRIALPASDHGDKGIDGHVLSKFIDHAGIYVVFQHWVKSPDYEAKYRAKIAAAAASGGVA